MSAPADDQSRIDTIPPPDGEDDPYNAPTAVSPMALAALQATLLNPLARTVPVYSQPAREVVTPPSSAVKIIATTDTPKAPLPRLYDDHEFETGLDPTDLFNAIQSGQTKLLHATTNISSLVALPLVSATRSRNLDIPPRVAEPMSRRPQQSRLRLSVIEIGIAAASFFTVTAVGFWVLLH